LKLIGKNSSLREGFFSRRRNLPYRDLIFFLSNKIASPSVRSEERLIIIVGHGIISMLNIMRFKVARLSCKDGTRCIFYLT